MAALDAGCARTTRPHWYAYPLVNDAQAMKIVFTPCLFLFVSFLFFLSLSLSFVFFLLSLHFFLEFFLSSTHHNNYDLHLRIIQILCLHISRSSLLRKTLTVNHYLHVKYFQQPLLEIVVLWPHLMRDVLAL